MRYLSLGLSMLWMGFALTLNAAETSDASQQVDKWIRQLGDRRYTQREEAVKKLKALGIKAIPGLKKALNGSSSEVRRSAKNLLSTLESEVVFAPTRITFKAKDMPLRRILDRIANQTGYQIELQGSGHEAKMSVDFKNKPFWEVIDHLCEQGGLLLQYGYSDARVRLTKTEGFAPWIQRNGMFRFAPSQFSQYRSINLQVRGVNNRTNHRSQSLSFSFYIFSEPKLPILGYAQPRILEAVDSEGNSMLRSGSGSSSTVVHSRSRYGSGYQSLSAQLSANLIRPSMKAERLKLIRGIAPLKLLKEQEVAVISKDLLNEKDKKLTVGMTAIHLEHCKPTNGNRYQIRVTFTNKDPEGGNDYSWLNTLYRRIEVQDKNGIKLNNVGNSWSNSSNKHVTMTLTVNSSNNAGKPSRFLYTDWKTIEHDVKFEFRDLPLP